MSDMKLINLSYILILSGLLLFALGFVAKDEINTLKLHYMPSDCHEPGDPSTCPILKNNVEWYIAFIWFLAFVNIFSGWYLRTYSTNDKSSLLESKIDSLSKKKESEERFSILLEGLDEDEKKVMQAVYDQDGIGQNTLHIRTSISKARLSGMLKDLEKRELIRKVQEGKINRIYLKKGFKSL
jgi:hypothetical protein